MKIKLPKEWKDNERRYLTTMQVASLSGLSHGTIFREIKAGKIKTVRTPGGHYRIDRPDAISFIKRMGITPGAKMLALVESL